MSGQVNVITSGGPLSEGGHLWGLASPSASLTQDGKLVPGGGGIVQITTVDGVLWAQSALNRMWFTYADGIWHSQGVRTPETEAKATSSPTNLHTTAITSKTISIAWNAPSTMRNPSYTVFIRRHGSSSWGIGATTKATSTTLTGLLPSTPYDIEVMAHT